MVLENDIRKGEVIILIALSAGSTKTAETNLKLAANISAKKIGPMIAEKTIKSLSIIVGKKIAKNFFAKLIPFLGGLIGASINASMISLRGKKSIAFCKNLVNKNLLYTGSLPKDITQIVLTQS